MSAESAFEDSMLRAELRHIRHGGMLAAREADLLPAILRALRRHPRVGMVWKTNPAPYGQSDILGILRGGQMLAVQVIAHDGSLTAEQKVFLNAIGAFGGVSFVARGIDDVIAQLGPFGR